MEKMSNRVVAIARNLRYYPGGLSEKELNSNYVEIHPLIEKKYVKVTSVFSTALYILTDEGRQWIDNYSAIPKVSRQKV